ncbi:MAG: MoaD/ThiS family protein [Bacteroidota bacterium]
MVSVEFTNVLKNFFPTLVSQEIEAKSLAEVLTQINTAYPGLSDYLVDETGCFREHISVYLDDEPLMRGSSTQQALLSGQRVFFFQAISGG